MFKKRSENFSTILINFLILCNNNYKLFLSCRAGLENDHNEQSKFDLVLFDHRPHWIVNMSIHVGSIWRTCRGNIINNNDS